MEYDLLPHTPLLCSTFPKTGRVERGVLRVQLALLDVSLVTSPLRVWCGSRDECFAFFSLLQPFSWFVLLVALLAPLALLCAPLSIGVRRGGCGGRRTRVRAPRRAAIAQRTRVACGALLPPLIRVCAFSLFAQLNY